MGKRKERRIAAMAASRRVKLDIFAEPPGDSGGSPAQDELGEDINPRHFDESPSSPLSSGKQPENPLVLLGQYSDDELEEQSSQQVATPDEASAVDCEQMNGLVATENEGKNGEEGANSEAPDEREHDLDEDKREQIDATEDDTHKKDVFVEETHLSEALDVPPQADVSTSWTLVLHEESGQYYYWNTVTGETSWVVPDAIASGTDLTGGQKTAFDAEKPTSPDSALDVELNGLSTENIGHHSLSSVRQDVFKEKNELGSLMQEAVDEQKDDNLEENVEKCKQNLMAHEGNDLDNDLCFSVLRHGESLLERIKSTQSSRSQVEEIDWISRYIFEVEIRLSDIKSLLSFGSSLLPFWVHFERKLKELEDAFDAKVCQFFIDEIQEAKAVAPVQSEGIEKETDVNCSNRIGYDIEKSHLSADADSPEVAKSGHVNSVEYLKVNTESNFEMSKTDEVTEVNPDTTVQYEEGEIQDVDMDMDVDMEVEDANEHHLHTNPPVEPISVLPEEDFDVPPPPGEEDWVPPPPPDSEPVPPPPPDDSSESFYSPPPPPDDQTDPSYQPLPTYPQAIQPLSYTGQYSFTYPSSGFEYYGQTTTEYPINNPYYETLTSSYPGATPVLDNPVDPISYYDVQDGTVIHGSVVSGATSSVFHGFDKISSLNSEIENSQASLPTGVNGGTKNETTVNSIVQTSTSVNNSVIESGPMPSAAAPAMISDVAKSAVSNVQPKVLRSKKRTISAAPTSRSNKKVSSLVDKWKAAKEELHEDEEDEPETAYDILEKKRQREIEKWKKQQIASGEAKDNANFQPLGGDWRERVKRKRDLLRKEDKKSRSDEAVDVNKQPDLTDLSRDLPSGWQAYWDESSKQVYYGNTVTSETTWIRPGK